MLTITNLADAEYLIGQVALGVDDYYMGAGEAPGVWQGGLAAEFSLAGVVEPDQLRALLLGRDPVSDDELLSARRPRTVTAYDVTFSAPKSVSLLWAFASPEVASVASIVHVEAVAVALDFLERRAGATRQQLDGERRRIPTGVAAATFVHRTSRDGDPQLHTHCVVANVGRRPDGTYAALDATPLYEWGRAAGSVYQEELRRRLTERLGVEWGPDRHGCREMAGFDSGWLRTFSKRTQAIDEYLTIAGPENLDPKRRMKADEAASLATRPRKDGSLTPEVLRARWQVEADAIGMPTGHALEAAVCDRVVLEFRPRVEWDDVVDALVEPEEGLCARRARFNEAHVVEHIAALGAGRLTVEAIEDAAEAFLGSEHAVRLTDLPGRTSAQYSTVDHLLLERRVLDLLDNLASSPVTVADATLIERVLAAEAPGLGHDQADAVRVLCGAGPAIRTVIAPAGFGKTTTVHAAAVSAAAAGHPVVGLAATNQAAGELRQAGMQAVGPDGHPVTLPRAFVEGHRPDGSPNCSHAWARTVDGIQGGTWPQVHLLGTATLERFTGYTGQSRSRHATHTWNVVRLPEIDHGGVVADQRTVDRKVLDALRRMPDTGFALHDAPSRVERLRAERAELRALLRERPPDRRPAFRQAEVALGSAKKELYWAQHRLEVAEQRLEELGPLSQVHRKGREVKRVTVEQIRTFTDDVRRAEAKIARWEEAVEELRPELDQRPRWDADHDWPDSRLRRVDAELAELTEPAGRNTTRDASLVRPAPGRNQPAWLDRMAEIARPSLPRTRCGPWNRSWIVNLPSRKLLIGRWANRRPPSCVSARRRQAAR